MTTSTGVPVAIETAEFPLWPLPRPTQFTEVCGVVASGAFGRMGCRHGCHSDDRLRFFDQIRYTSTLRAINLANKRVHTVTNITSYVTRIVTAASACALHVCFVYGSFSDWQ
jgi:hypothetical protein